MIMIVVAVPRVGTPEKQIFHQRFLFISLHFQGLIPLVFAGSH